MKIIKHLERILAEYSWIFKIGIVLFWIFWAGGLWKPLSIGLKAERDCQKSRNIIEEREKISCLYNFVKETTSKAKSLGCSYGPHNYFEDLKAIYAKEEELGCSAGCLTSELTCIVDRNIKKGLYSTNEISIESQAFSEWLKGGRKKGEIVTNVSSAEIKRNRPKNFSDFLTWLLIFYRRSIFLAITFFLLRMAERNGILETILAEKRKFALAALGWPFYFHKYPYNVVREIRVEAELRRLGKIFRRLTVQEQEMIRRIANSDQYFNWINAFRAKNESRFQRGLIIALLAILCLRVVWPVVSAEASTRNGSIRYTVISMPINQSAISQTIHNLGLEIVDPGQWCLPVETMEVSKPKFLGRIYPSIKLLPRKILLKRIDHIPLCDYLVELVCSTK